MSGMMKKLNKKTNSFRHNEVIYLHTQKKSSIKFNKSKRKKFPVKMTKLLVNFTVKIVYLLWLQNSRYIYSSIINPVNVTE